MVRYTMVVSQCGCLHELDGDVCRHVWMVWVAAAVAPCCQAPDGQIVDVWEHRPLEHIVLLLL